MKKTSITLCLIILMMNQMYSQSNEKEDPQIRWFGLGLAFQTYDQYWAKWTPGSKLLIVFSINEAFRIEPEIGYGSYFEERNTTSHKRNDLLLGLNAYPIINRNRINILPGIKLGYIWSNGFYDDPPNSLREFSSGGIYFAPMMGLEYYFSTHFSIGGEIGLLIQKEKSDNTWDGDSYEELTSNTLAELKFRFYF